MKNKLVKRNMTKFDYRARKLGIFGAILAVLSLAVILPISANISSNNVALTNEIQGITNDIKHDNIIVFEGK